MGAICALLKELSDSVLIEEVGIALTEVAGAESEVVADVAVGLVGRHRSFLLGDIA